MVSSLQQYQHHWAASTKHLLHSGQCTFRCGVQHHSVSFEWCWTKQEKSITSTWWVRFTLLIHDFLKPIYTIHIFFTLCVQLFHHCSVKILGQLLKVSTSFSFNVAMNVSASIFIVFPADASIMELSNYTDTSTESSNLTDSFTESSNLTLPDTYIYTRIKQR